MNPKKTDAKINPNPTTEKKIALLAQYQVSSRKDRDILWIRHTGLRPLFDGVETAEIFITDQSPSAFSIHRFKSRTCYFTEYQTIF